MSALLPRGLYGMLDVPQRKLRRAEVPRRSPALDLAQALLAGGVKVLQLRMKGAGAAQMLSTLEELRPMVRRYSGVKLIVNDRLDVALAAGADGVHLGQTDLPLRTARQLAPQGFLIGISTHNEDQAEAAMEGGADYIAVGPIFPTRSKANPDPVVGIERLADICAQAPVPVVAIGGIDPGQVPFLVEAGAHAVAIIRAINQAEDMQAVTQRAAQVMACFEPA